MAPGLGANLQLLLSVPNLVSMVVQEVWDASGRAWAITLKTWQNVVRGEHRPTFVLENTGQNKVEGVWPGCACDTCCCVAVEPLHASTQ